MIELIPHPTVLQAAGTPPKTISEFVGRLTTGSSSVSVAIMDSPSGWAEPGQRPEFDEYTVVLEGEVHIDTDDGSIAVGAGQAARAPAGTWVRYSTPGPGGARYVAVCVPAFSPDAVNRDDDDGAGPSDGA
jgi:mannose-6-phosphate isomerase-like protein (cupin superfamily)